MDFRKNCLLNKRGEIIVRLFIAINFHKEFKDIIENIVTELKGYSLKGKFVDKEYFHLTVEFLGEIPEEKIESIKNIMNKISAKSFSLELEEIGFFPRKEGDIHWIGIEKNEELLKIKSQLYNMLKEEGVKLEKRRYKPHLTIGRKVIMDKNFSCEELLETVKGLSVKIDKIDLMKSEHKNGKLTHTVIYSKDIL